MTVSRFVKWWNESERALHIKAERKERYENDPAFKAKERLRKRGLWQRKRFEASLGKSPNPRIYHANGADYVILPVGTVARLLGVSKRTVSNLERRGVIPTNRVIDDNRRRWWPETYIMWLKPLFELKKLGILSIKELSQRVWSRWSQAVADNLFPVVVEDKNGQAKEGRYDKSRCSLIDIFKGH